MISLKCAGTAGHGVHERTHHHPSVFSRVVAFRSPLFGLSFTASVVSGYDVLVNEDKTRSFVCLRVRGGRQMVLKLIAKVDPLMRRFKQAAYYEVILRTQGW